MPVQTKHVLLGRRNQITLPRAFVSDHVKMFECERREDGTIVLTPQITVPAGQAYFWTARWRKGEAEASKDITQGRLTRFRSGREMFQYVSKRRKKR